MRAVVVSLLAILAVALSQMTVAARADASLGGEMQVLCSDIGPVAVLIGPDGAPADPAPHRHCPDCLPLSQPTALARPVHLPAPVWSVALAFGARCEPSHPVPAPCLVPAARGPPGVS